MPEVPICNLCEIPIDLQQERYAYIQRKTSSGVAEYTHTRCWRKDVGLPEVLVCWYCQESIDEADDAYVVVNRSWAKEEKDFQYAHAYCQRANKLHLVLCVFCKQPIDDMSKLCETHAGFGHEKCPPDGVSSK